MVLSGEGQHFCAGLDLSEVAERSVAEGILHSRMWHAAFELVQFGRVPVVSVLHGAVVGGGLELASATHIRVAERSTFYGLPEGQRGLFVGGGGSARVPRLVGVARMTDMMLTGRVLDAAEGHAVGLSQYLVDDGAGLAKAFELGEEDRRQRAAVELLGHACPAAHRRPVAVRRTVRRIADGRHRAGRRRRQAARSRLPRRPRRQGGEVVSAAAPVAAAAAPKYRAAHVGGCVSATLETHADGSLVLRSTEPLQPYPARVTDRLEHWAREAPDRTFVARRAPGGGDWQRIGYAEMLDRAQRVGQALVQRGLSVERPVAILSENDLEHLTLALGALWAGIPYTPVSSAYSLVSSDHAKLRHIFGVTTPGLVFASGAAYAKAIAAVAGPDVEIVLTESDWRRHGGIGRPQRHAVRRPARRPQPGPEVAAAHAATGPDTIAKFLFTSGSTKDPKGVVNTNRMMCANQQMLAPVHGLPRRRAAGAGRLAALEPHLRRQPQRRHRAATTAARSTSTTASRRRAAWPRRCATCARSRPPSTSTCPRASRRSPSRWTATPRCASRSTAA